MRISDWSSDVCSSDLISIDRDIADLSRHEAGGDAELSGYAVMACGMGVAQMAHGAATVVFDSTAQKLFELPNSLTISQIFARTGRGDRRWRSEERRVGKGGGRTGKSRG